MTVSLRSALTLLAILLVSVCLTDSSLATDREDEPESPIRLVVSVDRPNAQVADPIELTCEVIGPPGTSVQMAGVGAKLGALEVVDRKLVKDIPIDGPTPQRRWTQTLTLESLRTGSLQIPPLQIQYRLADQSDWRSLVSEPIDIEIASLIEQRADPTLLRDLKPPVDIQTPEPSSNRAVYWVLGGLAATSLLGLAAFVIWRRPDETPEHWALREIDLLEHPETLQHCDAISVYEQLSRIVRTYLEWRFGTSFPSGPTPDSISKTEPENNALTELQRLLEGADEVRFARLDHDQTQLTEAMERARKLIAECELAEKTREHHVTAEAS